MSKEYQEWQEFQDMEFERKLQEQPRNIEDRNERFNRAEMNYIQRIAPSIAIQAEADCELYIMQNYQQIMQERGCDEFKAKQEAKKQFIWSK
jgi:hypothetical protein